MKKTYLNYFNDYLLDVKITKTKGTYNYYVSHLLHAGKFFYNKNITKLSEVDRDTIVSYITMQRNNVENSTLNKRVGILKRCFLFYGLNDNFIFNIPKYKEKKTSFDMIPDNQLKRIINYIGSLDLTHGNNLMYANIIFILINTGIRRTELLNIRKKNVNLKENEILLTKTKSGKDRIVYFRPVITPVIELMIQTETEHPYLLHNLINNRKANENDIVYCFKKIKNKLMIEKLHPHMFRHTFATKLLQSGVDINTVKDFMGHTNLATTQRYLHTDREHSKKEYLTKYKY